MKPTTSITNPDHSIRSAQDAVDISLAKFETALSHLAERVEQTSHRVEHVGELARRSRDEIIHLKREARAAVDPLVPYFRQGKEISARAIDDVKENPKPYLWTLVGLVGAFFAMRTYQNRSQSKLMAQNPKFENTMPASMNSNSYVTGAPI